jgi:transposase
MARISDLRTQQRWLELVRRWQRSQLAVRTFCNLHGLQEASFYGWRRLLRQRGLITEPLQPGRKPSAAAAVFVPVALAAEPATASAVDLVLADGRLLRVRPGFDPDLLLELVRLLERPPC